eukprot:CAMPEP_0116878664 /NCGR_PEP_ID=MMETSP0463-20121206/10415_1 /TAXON_ID=181622 /ORGANISM="Strombidinopsis sp, Strain SopsisLIS2011" /LENGTH=93 /DNA_ID=CAMNT_0004527113 /DNA_START=46 /DNA_END=327 /DNA_ORIENTATION=-
MAEESLLDYKPSSLLFIEANEALLACYQEVNLEEYNKMSVGQQNQICIEPKKVLRNILAKNQMTMSIVVKDRVELWKAIEKKGINHKFEHTEF